MFFLFQTVQEFVVFLIVLIKRVTACYISSDAFVRD